MPQRRSRPDSPGRCWKVGELAERAGLTVRTLHHYDAIGLLSPSGRTDSAHGSGHRLYTAADVARLQQIASLKQLGFSLEQIRDYLARDDYDPRQVVRLHLERVRGQAAELRRLEGRLAALADTLEAAETPSADDFLATIKEIAMIEKYYTPEQLEQIVARRDAAPERVQRAPGDWVALGAEIAAAVAAGIEPSDPRAQAIARRWYALVSEFTGGDPATYLSLKRMYQGEDTIRGMDVAAQRPAMDWVERAALAAGIELPGS